MALILHTYSMMKVIKKIALVTILICLCAPLAISRENTDENASARKVLLPIFFDVTNSEIFEQEILSPDEQLSTFLASPCPVPSIKPTNENLDLLLKDVPKLILGALLRKAERETRLYFDKRQAITARLFIPRDTRSQTKTQKMIVAGTAISGGILGGALYLKDREIDLNQNFIIPFNGLLHLADIQLNFRGQKLGFSSDSPYAQMTLELNFENNYKLSIEGGSSRIDNQDLEGVQMGSASLSVPLSSGLVSQLLTLQTGAIRQYRGEIKNEHFTQENYYSNLIYTLNASSFDSNFNAGLSIKPISVSSRTEEVSPENIETSIEFASSASANVRFVLMDLIDYQALFELNASGGSTYDLNGNGIPFYGINANLSILPKPSPDIDRQRIKRREIRARESNEE